MRQLARIVRRVAAEGGCQAQEGGQGKAEQIELIAYGHRGQELGSRPTIEAHKQAQVQKT